MGNHENGGRLNTGILEFIHEEYDRVIKNKDRKYLTLS